MEQIRIIKEMRDADIRRGRTGQFIRPRFMVWENVPGAFSSNKGDDFRAVLEETIRVADPDAPDVPLPPKGKWPLADCWMGDGWSVAYRVLDAQFWGVPQRRRRIALVADFGGHAAPEILFVRQSVCGDFETGGAPGETFDARIETGFGAAIALRMRAGCEGGGKGALIQVEKSGTLGCNNDQTIICLNDQGGHIMGTSLDVTGTMRVEEYSHQPIIGYEEEKASTLTSEQQVSVYDARGNGDGKTVCTLTGDHQDRVTDYTAIVMQQKSFGEYREGVGTLTSGAGHEYTEHLVVTGVDRRNGTESADVVATLQAHNSGGFSLNCTHPVRIGGEVRRLTPLECERLQGYPDGWTDIGDWADSKGKIHKPSDSARYKALGNSIALPPWAWLLKRLCGCYERTATMASLFDGIGGFPLIWERLNGPGSCLWASEIEEFPIAVTKLRFGGKGAGL